mgnify:CR=1 FL=1
MSNVLNLNNIGKNFLLSLETRGIKLGLKRTVELFNICNHPEDNLKSIQVIGTNGKGSTAATLSSILMASGLKVGLYTSPHLVDLSERIKINNLINEWELSNIIDTEFQSLSDGQKRRGLLARALVYEPNILVLDEPFCNLDIKSNFILNKNLNKLINQSVNILYVTHNL